MSGDLPEFLDLLKLARMGTDISGSIDLSAMRRLAPLLYSDEGMVNVEIELGTDSGHIPFLKGLAVTRPEMICQRCLESFGFDLKAEFNLGLVTGGSQMENLPKQYEPLQIMKEPMSLYEIVEDELMLSLPIVALHELDKCPAADELEKLEKGKKTPETAGKDNPFSVLEKLKTH